MVVQTSWKLLVDKLKALQEQKKSIMVVYDIGHGKETAVSLIEKAKDDGLKMVGHYWLGFVNIIEIRCGGEILYSSRMIAETTNDIEAFRRVELGE